MKIFYRIAIYLIVLASFFRKRSRKAFSLRWGNGFPRVNKEGRPLIWVHAVSVGETKAIAPLVKKLQEHPSKPLILLSSITSTGHEEAKRCLPQVDWHVFLPFDLPRLIERCVRSINPDLVILTETDFWHYFEKNAKKCRASIIVVNGKLSERSFKRYLAFPSFAKLLLQPIDLFCVQDKLYAERFSRLGIDTSRIRVTGNIKLDGLDSLDVSGEWRKKLALKTTHMVLTCGSTHDPEEKILLRALNELWSQFPQLKVLFVPRHPERFEAVASLLAQERIPFGRLSQQDNFAEKKILLVDAMGVLRSCYQISDLAFVGGTFNPRVGGHNILEPSTFGVPVIFGPYMFSQPQFLELARSYQAGIQVTEQNLKATLEQLFKDPKKRTEIGRNGFKLVQEAKGASDATFHELAHFLSLAEKGAS